MMSTVSKKCMIYLAIPGLASAVAPPQCPSKPTEELCRHASQVWRWKGAKPSLLIDDLDAVPATGIAKTRSILSVQDWDTELRMFCVYLSSRIQLGGIQRPIGFSFALVRHYIDVLLRPLHVQQQAQGRLGMLMSL